MKNGKIRFIPLQADLCLNKQKVDIADFNGWQKCNAPVYGDCLSPLYTKKDTHHDIFIGNDTYDFSQGTLYKNGVEVLSGAGSKKIKKTKINEDYECIAISEEGTITGAKIISATTIAISIEGRPFTTFDMSFYNIESILTVKAYSNSEYDSYGIVVLGRDTSSRLMLFWWKITDIGRATYTYVDNDFQVINPFIQIKPINENGDVIVSVFSNSGANISNVDVRNYYLEVDNNMLYFSEITGFTDDSELTERYKAIDQSVGFYVKVDTVVKNASGMSTGASGTVGNLLSGVTQIEVIEQTITVMLDRVVSYPVTVNLKYLKPDGTYAQGTNESFTISAGSRSYTRKFTYTNYLSNINMPLTGTVSFDYNPSIKINNNGTIVTPTISGNTALVYPCYVANVNGKPMSTFLVETTVMSDKNPNNPTTPQNLVATNRSFPVGIDDGTKFVLKGMAFTTKKGIPTVSLDSVNNVLNTLDTVSTEVPTEFPSVLLITPLSYEVRAVSPSTASTATATFATPFLPYMSLGNYPVMWSTTSKGFDTAPNTYDILYRFLKEAYTTNVFGNVDCCMDNGLLYCCKGLDVTTDTPMPTQAFALAGEFLSYVSDQAPHGETPGSGHVLYDATSIFDVSYDVDEQNVFPKYYDGMSLSLGVGLFKGMYQFKAQKDAEDKIYVMIDSLAMEEGEDASHLNPGVLQGSDYNYQGSVKNTYGVNGWRLLFNNNIISNVGCYENSNWIGTILADWFTIKETFNPTYNHSTLIYKDLSNNIWRLDLVDSGEDWGYKFIENRYIVLNTINYFNCYDVVTGLKRHWASDFNNRIVFGYAFKKYTNDATFKALLTTPLFRGLTITGQNPNYEMTQDYITGLELGALLYEKCLIDYKAFLSCDVPYDAVETIDIYRGDNDSTSAIYIESYKNGLKQINVDLTNPYAVYPISQNGDIRYNPNLFSQFIKSYNNSDMVLSDGVAYKLQYFNNVTPVMAFYMLDGVEGLENAFVLQTIYYGVSATRLYEMAYNNGASVSAIADIRNLEYLGALPSQALFWSAQNRAIYTFKGNCILTLTQYANDLTGIYGKWYNPATQELFLDTNIGLLVFSDLGTYCLEWSTETNSKSVEDMFFFKDKFAINFINDTAYTHYYSYNNLEGYESNNIYIITKYYGNGLVPITVNNIYIRLYNQHVANAQGSIKFKGYTITDVGTETDEKEVLIGGVDDPTHQPPLVAGEAWDTETDTMLVKYTPQYNRGLGFALKIESTFPIIDIKFDYVENGSVESQIGHINI